MRTEATKPARTFRVCAAAHAGGARKPRHDRPICTSHFAQLRRQAKLPRFGSMISGLPLQDAIIVLDKGPLHPPVALIRGGRAAETAPGDS